MYDGEAKRFKYVLLEGYHHMFGTEGMLLGMMTHAPTRNKELQTVSHGLIAQSDPLILHSLNHP